MEENTLAFHAIATEITRIITEQGDGFYITLDKDRKILDVFQVSVPQADSDEIVIQVFGDKQRYAPEHLTRLCLKEEVNKFVKLPEIWNHTNTTNENS